MTKFYTTQVLDTLTLKTGVHKDFESGACLLEAASYIAGEPWSDHPECVSPVLGEYGRRLNDSLRDGRRQELKQYIPRLIGTAGDGQDEARSYVALDWLIRTYTPAFLELAGLDESARALRGLRRIVDYVAAQSAGPVVLEARKEADAAADAAWAATGAAARAAAGDAAWDAARIATGDAAGAAARIAAGAAAGAAARAAAGAAAWAAARDAARFATGDAAWAALKPTVGVLQVSAIALFDTMIDPAGAVQNREQK